MLRPRVSAPLLLPRLNVSIPGCKRSIAHRIASAKFAQLVRPSPSGCSQSGDVRVKIQHEAERDDQKLCLRGRRPREGMFSAASFPPLTDYV